jgi:hypothetical protein
MTNEGSYGAVLGVLSLMLLGYVCRRGSRFPLMFLVRSVISILNGCENLPTSSGGLQVAILTIRATSGTGTAMIVHFAQVARFDLSGLDPHLRELAEASGGRTSSRLSSTMHGNRLHRFF